MLEEGKTLRLTRSEFESLKGGAAVASLSDWVVYRIQGEDSLEWLQGQATNDLRSLASENRLIESCLCSATGQLTALFLVGRFGEQLYLITPAACESEVLQRVDKMVILEEVELEKTSLSARIQASLQKGDSTPTWSTKILLETGLSLSLVPRHEVEERPKLSQDAIESLLVLSGTPRFGRDTQVKTLPPELGPDFDSRFVHYAKGCYMGQEVLQRIHSRGRTNKTWAQIEILDGNDLEGPFEFEGLSTVPILSHIRLDSGVALLGAYLRNDSFEYGKTIQLIDSLGNTRLGTVRRMPIYPFA